MNIFKHYDEQTGQMIDAISLEDALMMVEEMKISLKDGNTEENALKEILAYD